MATAGVEARLDPSTVSSDYTAMARDWETIGDILAGADAVKAKGTRYLPKFTKESSEAYNLRKESAPWRPEFADALGSLVSKPFSKTVALNQNAPDVFSGTIADPATKQRRGGLVDDIDGQGNSLHVFARDAFYHGVGYGLDAIYVTYPEVEPAKNLAEEKAIGARPYWVHVRGRDIIDLKLKVIAGRTVVSSIRIRECTTEPDGFAEASVERIRSVYLNEANRPAWVLYRKGADDKYFEERSGSLVGVTEIPVALFFTGPRSGNYRVKPPLADLAGMALELYRARSRLDEIQTLAGSPMLVGKGLAPPQPTPVIDGDGRQTGERPAAQIEVGPKVVLFAPPAVEGVQPDWGYIQPVAANMTELRESVDKTADDFRSLALQPTTPRSGNMVATGQAIDAAKSHSAVEAWANGLKDCLDQALKFTCQWLKVADTVTAQVHTDFGVDLAGTEEAKVIGDAQKRGVISAKTEREELSRRGVLGPSFDEEQEELRLAEEQQGLEPEEPIDPLTGKPINDNVAPEGVAA